VVLTGVGSNLLESDIRRLKLSKKHLPNFKDHYDIVKVIPNRHVETLVRRPAYNIVFGSATAAQTFLITQRSAFSGPPSQWPDIPLPPGSVPKFSPAGFKAVKEQEEILPNLIKSRTSVLLTVSEGARNMGKLPTTQEVRELLEDQEVVFDRGDANDMAYGVQEMSVRRDKSGLVAEDSQKTIRPYEERKWIVRCSNVSEAHRVVSRFHQRKPWSTVVTFRAEVIY